MCHKLPAFLICLLGIVALARASSFCPLSQMYVTVGQTVCERQCMVRPGGPTMRCLRMSITGRISICPQYCCRDGRGCQRVYPA